MTRLVGSPAGRWVVVATGGFAATCGAAYAVAAPASAGWSALLAALIIGAWCTFLRRRTARFALVSVVMAVALMGVWRGSVAVDVPGKGTVDGHLGTGPVSTERHRRCQIVGARPITAVQRGHDGVSRNG